LAALAGRPFYLRKPAFWLKSILEKSGNFFEKKREKGLKIYAGL